MFCPKCGKELADGTRFCDACGAATDGTAKSERSGAHTDPQTANEAKDFLGIEDKTAEFDAEDIEKNKVLSLFSYLGVLVLVPLLAAKDSKFARFHINQGLTLLLAEIVFGIVWSILGGVFEFVRWSIAYWVGAVLGGIVSVVFGLLSLVPLALAIIGIVDACSGKAKTLPLLGRLHLFDRG